MNTVSVSGSLLRGVAAGARFCLSTVGRNRGGGGP